ncbi:hypothetical protein C8Q79DRAFT_207602 [Trametes meyenii]|nr:hypothetical protein C8Q79DRAFT_207602 [Trametes meyenii]
MATVTHYIYSHYEPPSQKDVDFAEEEFTEEDTKDPWVTESSFGARRRLANPPRFVPAAVSYDEVNDIIGGASSSIPHELEPLPSSHVSDWYKALPRASALARDPRTSNSPISSLAAVLPSNPPTQFVSSPTTATLSPPASTDSSFASGVASSRTPLHRTKNDWFISKAITSESAPLRVASTPTLADILSREPPPERKEQPFVPPVFLHIGPSNKGFAMLQQSGWSEGEALGAGAARRTLSQKAREKRPARTILDDPQLAVKTEEREVALDRDGDIREVRKVEVVDLTLSDSDEDEVEELAGTSAAASGPSSLEASHNPTALLTPIATVLKSDRLGIGLKAKTVGPHKESKKRVTHNQAALAAHVRETEEMRMRKSILGRGAKSFARIAKAEAESRRRLLASLNAD